MIEKNYNQSYGTDWDVYAAMAHANAARKGFWDEEKSQDHCMMLVITEVSEAVEANRRGLRVSNGVADNNINHTVEMELADIVIRLLDLAGHLGIDFKALSPCRYRRSFDRFDFTENAYALVKGLCKREINIFRRVQFGLEYVAMWADSEDIDLMHYVDKKISFNQAREHLHGKNY